MTPVKITSEEIELEYKLNTELDLNPMGNMHGGRMAYILDSVMSALASDFDKTDVNSLNFSVSYLNGISKDLESFLVTAKIVKGGRAMAFVTAELRLITFDTGICYTGNSDLKPAKSTHFQKEVFRKALE